MEASISQSSDTDNAIAERQTATPMKHRRHFHPAGDANPGNAARSSRAVLH